MISNAKAAISEFLVEWVRFVTRIPGWVLFISFTLVAAAGFYAAGHLGVITDTSEMLSEKLRYLQIYRHYKKEFPHSYDRIVIVIDGLTPDLASDARDRLASALRKHSDLFHWVYLPGDDTFFKKEGLLFLSVSELETLGDRLAQAEPLMASLVERPDLQGFFSILSLAMDAEKKGERIDLSPVFSELTDTLRHINHKRFYQLSWMRLMSGSGSSPSTRQFVIVQPAVNYETVLPGKTSISIIRDIVKDLNLVPDRGIKVMLTGDIPMQYDELKSVTQGAKTAGLLSFIMVSIVLITGLGSFRLVLATLAPLIAGLVWTAFFAALAVGHLNMISVAFAVLFIGLSVDYAVHLCLRYRELLVEGIPSREAIIASARDVGPSLILCALTTSIGFYSFMPTDFSGVAELGLIAGTGMFIGLFSNLTILPAVIAVLPLSASGNRPYYIKLGGSAFFFKFLTIPYKHGRLLRITAVFLTMAAFWYVPKIRFDSNPINLRDPHAESIIAFKKLLEDPNSSPWSLESLAPNKQQAAERAERFKTLQMVRHALTLESFIPKDQQDKLDIIYDLSMIMDPVVNARIDALRTVDPSEEIKSLKSFVKRLQERAAAKSVQQGPDLSQNLLSELLRFMKETEALPPDQQAIRISVLREAVLGSFPSRVRDLKLALSAQSVSERDIPADLKSEWVGVSGVRRINVVPRKNPSNDEEIRKWIQEARTVDQDITGYAVLIMEGGKVVLNAFKEAFTASLAAISLLLLLLMPYKRDALIVFFSLILAGILTGGLMVLSGIDLNFANIIALPLILGIGVDNGIHIVHRFRKALSRPVTILETSTARAIVFSTLTTICSFGNLAVSPHVGMASMGKLLTIGISMALLTAILIIPAFLTAYCSKA